MGSSAAHPMGSREERRDFAVEAHRQSLLIAQAARDPNSDVAAVMREIQAELADASFWDESAA